MGSWEGKGQGQNEEEKEKHDAFNDFSTPQVDLESSLSICT